MARYNNMMDRAIQIQAMKDAREGRAMQQQQMQAEDDENLRYKNSVYAENAAANAFGGIDRNGQDMVLDNAVGEGAAWRPQATGDESEIGTRSWQDAIRQQQMQKANEQTAAFDKAQDGIANIEMLNKQKVALDNQNRNQWLIGLVSSANRNGGMSDRSLAEGASKALGQQIYGVQRLNGLSGKEAELNGSYAVYGAKDDGRGGQTVGVVGVVTPETILKTLDKLGAGAKYNQLRQQLWTDGGFDRYTPEQQANMGLRNPNAISVAGSTAISGNVSKRLFGERNWRPSGVTTTAFSADGTGGTTTWRKDWSTGETWKEEGGTRDPSYRMQKLQEEEMKRTMEHNEEMRKRQRDADISNYFLYDDGHSSADGTKKYRNSATGEVVSVKKGENLRDALARPDIEKAKRGRRYDDDGKDARLRAQNEARILSDQAKTERQERELRHREWARMRAEMANRRKQLETATVGDGALKERRYDDAEVEEMLRKEFPTMFDSNGKPVMWDYNNGSADNGASAPDASKPDNGDGFVNVSDSSEIDPGFEAEPGDPGTNVGKTESPVVDNNGGDNEALEFDPKGTYTVGSRFFRNVKGKKIVYEVTGPGAYKIVSQ